MYIDTHNLLVFFHLALFVYAIGGDIAVYCIGKYVVRDELDLDERLRVRQIRIMVDMSARTCLVLLLPLGFTLALNFGSPLAGVWLTLLWVASVAWLVLVWTVHAKAGTRLGTQLKNVDIAIRYLVAVVMLGFGAYCLAAGGPVTQAWLAAKILLFGGVVLNGIWIRSVLTHWPAAIEQARAGGDTAIKGEAAMKANQALTNKAALLIWILVMVMAFLGKLKPF